MPDLADLVIRIARPDDLPAIVGLHEADLVGGHGDRWDETTAPVYREAFAALSAHPDHDVFVATLDGAVVGSFVLCRLQLLTGRGTVHVQLHSVQVRADLRSRGIGAAMVASAEGLARARGAAVLSLTSNLNRVDAHRFYERLGYERCHAGFRKRL